MPLFVPKDRKSLFRQFLAGMYDAVVITDPNGHILDVNPRAEEHFGQPLEEVVDQPVSVLLPGLATEVVQRIRRALAEDRRILVDANGRRRDGTAFVCEVSVSVLDYMDPDDLVFTIRNIERRRLFREAMREKETAFEIAGSALFVCAPDGRFLQANAAFRDMFGLTDEAAVRERAFSDFLADDPLPANFAKALAGERSEVTLVSEIESEGGGEAATESVTVVLAPVTDGKKPRAVAGSVTRETPHA